MLITGRDVLVMSRNVLITPHVMLITVDVGEMALAGIEKVAHHQRVVITPPKRADIRIKSRAALTWKNFLYLLEEGRCFARQKLVLKSWVISYSYVFATIITNK